MSRLAALEHGSARDAFDPSLGGEQSADSEGRCPDEFPGHGPLRRELRTPTLGAREARSALFAHSAETLPMADCPRVRALLFARLWPRLGFTRSGDAAARVIELFYALSAKGLVVRQTLPAVPVPLVARLNRSGRFVARFQKLAAVFALFGDDEDGFAAPGARFGLVHTAEPTLTRPLLTFTSHR